MLRGRRAGNHAAGAEPLTAECLDLDRDVPRRPDPADRVNDWPPTAATPPLHTGLQSVGFGRHQGRLAYHRPTSTPPGGASVG